jgi:hypothetical protein
MKTIIFMATVIATFCLFNSRTYTQEVRTYTVVNKTGVIITDVNLSYTNTNRWGSTLNSTPLLISGNSFTFKQPLYRNNCNYDIRYRGGDGRLYYLNNVDLCNNSSVRLVLTKNYNKDERVNK